MMNEVAYNDYKRIIKEDVNSNDIIHILEYIFRTEPQWTLTEVYFMDEYYIFCFKGKCRFISHNLKDLQILNNYGVTLDVNPHENNWNFAITILKK